ncbi:MAG: hypothetical protein ACE5GJ_04035 [Gemmatimonadota bacterium]
MAQQEKEGEKGLHDISPVGEDSSVEVAPDTVIPFDRLPERFARRIASPPDTPSVPRPAATVVLVRPGARGPEILLLRRVRSAGFVPGAYVFPGGRVDRADADPAVLEHLEGLTPRDAVSRLGLDTADESARSEAEGEAAAGGDSALERVLRGHPARLPAPAYYVAALREAFEETGLLIGRRRDGTFPPSAAEDGEVEALRRELMEDRITFPQVLERLDCRLAGDRVEYIAHWITPEAEPRRYDTRFFAAAVPEGAEAAIDSREMTDALWLTAAEALERHTADRLPMVFPTIKTLEQLAAFSTVEELLATMGRRTIPTILPRLVLTPTGVGLALDS